MTQVTLRHAIKLAIYFARLRKDSGDRVTYSKLREFIRSKFRYRNTNQTAQVPSYMLVRSM